MRKFVENNRWKKKLSITYDTRVLERGTIARLYKKKPACHKNESTYRNRAFTKIA